MRRLRTPMRRRRRKKRKRMRMIKKSRQTYFLKLTILEVVVEVDM